MIPRGHTSKSFLSGVNGRGLQNRGRTPIRCMQYYVRAKRFPGDLSGDTRRHFTLTNQTVHVIGPVPHHRASTRLRSPTTQQVSLRGELGNHLGSGSEPNGRPALLSEAARKHAFPTAMTHRVIPYTENEPRRGAAHRMRLSLEKLRAGVPARGFKTWCARCCILNMPVLSGGRSGVGGLPPNNGPRRKACWSPRATCGSVGGRDYGSVGHRQSPALLKFLAAVERKVWGDFHPALAARGHSWS